MQTRSPENIPIIDVSKHQGNINWLAVAADAAGIKGVMIKATEGVGYVDPLFRRNAVGAPAAGLAVGFYHYCRPETGNSACEEAEHFAETVAGLPAQLPHVLDVEGAAEDLGSAALTAWCVEWLETVERLTGHRCMIYTGASFARSYLGVELYQWPLWVAHYGVQTPLGNPTWSRWAMHQYTDKGSISGIASAVDFNEMDAEFWRELTGAPAAKQEGEDEAVMNEELKLTTEEWGALSASLDKAYYAGLLGDYRFVEKAQKGTLTRSGLEVAVSIIAVNKALL